MHFSAQVSSSELALELSLVPDADEVCSEIKIHSGNEFTARIHRIPESRIGPYQDW